MNRVLTVVPVNPRIPRAIYKKSLESVGEMVRRSECDNNLLLDFTPEPSSPDDKRHWSKVTRVRNKILDTYPIHNFSHLLWVDADIVEVPIDLADRLLNTNKEGVAAPMVLVEGTDIFYDWTAFILKGRDVVEPHNKEYVEGRNVSVDPPYVEGDFPMEWDCVGSVTLVNTEIYKHARYEDHPAFTDHYPICAAARNLGLGVKVDNLLFTYHADLLKYGLDWH